ncbi:MAG: VOC family protein [Hyphomonadaceae bacterium]|nr:VOC family protein [Hyphomonadaceae bacterium]
MSHDEAGAAAIKGVCQIGIASLAPEKLVAFYRDVLGFPVLFEAGGMTFMRAGATSLMIGAVPNAQTPSGDVMLYFEPADWNAAETRLEAAGIAFDRPAMVVQRDGAREHMLRPFKDPEGRPVYLMGWREA